MKPRKAFEGVGRKTFGILGICGITGFGLYLVPTTPTLSLGQAPVIKTAKISETQRKTDKQVQLTLQLTSKILSKIDPNNNLCTAFVGSNSNGKIENDDTLIERYLEHADSDLYFDDFHIDCANAISKTGNVDYYLRALNIQRKPIQYYQILLNALLKYGNIDYYLRAIEIQGKPTQYYISLLNAILKDGNIDHYSRIIEVQGKPTQYYTSLLNAILKKGEPDELKKLLEGSVFSTALSDYSRGNILFLTEIA